MALEVAFCAALLAQSAVAGHPSATGDPNPTMGVLNVDGANLGAKTHVPGDVNDGVRTFDYPVHYVRVEGLTFDACMAGPVRNASAGAGEWQFPEARVTVAAGLPPAAHLFFPSPIAGTAGAGVRRQPSRVERAPSGDVTYVYAGEAVRRNVDRAYGALAAAAGGGQRRGAGTVVGVGSDCGFNEQMDHYLRDADAAARRDAWRPVALSSLSLLPLLAALLGPPARARIGIMTANSTAFERHLDALVPRWSERGLVVIGCQDVPGFGREVAQGLPVNGSYVAPHVLRLAQHALDRHASTPAPVRALLLECTELPPYTGLLRASLSPRVPVWDAVSLMDLLHAGFRAPDYGWDKRSVSD